MSIAARARLHRSRPHFALATLAAVAGAALAPVATAAPITFLPGDLAVLYSVYPGLPNPNTGNTGGYTMPNISRDNGSTDQPECAEPAHIPGHRRRRRPLSQCFQQCDGGREFWRHLADISRSDYARG
jgi:hypothetical protein